MGDWCKVKARASAKVLAFIQEHGNRLRKVTRLSRTDEEMTKFYTAVSADMAGILPDVVALKHDWASSPTSAASTFKPSNIAFDMIYNPHNLIVHLPQLQYLHVHERLNVQDILRLKAMGQLTALSMEKFHGMEALQLICSVLSLSELTLGDSLFEFQKRSVTSRSVVEVNLRSAGFVYVGF